MIALLALVVSCTTLPELSPTVTTETSIKQPEPSRPLISGELSGLPDSTTVTIHIRTLNGREAYTVAGPSPGPWEAVVTEASSSNYVVTAEVAGYASYPVSYTIHLIGTTAYVIENGETTTEALHLDFHFEPVEIP